MSAFGGVYYPNLSCIEENVLSIFDEGLAARGPDGGSSIHLGPVGMVYRAFHTNRESRLEKQPFCSADQIAVTWDGRLDNRDELKRSLDFRSGGPVSDVALVSAAYSKWGLDFLGRLVGDYALALWDARERRLLLARDPFGIRPLFYHVSPKGILWSSEFPPFFALADDCADIDDDYIAGYLTGTEDPERTPYKNISAVEPGTSVLFLSSGQIQRRLFWDINPKHEIRYSRDSEYEEHFRSLFKSAVQSRLRTDAPVMAELSGGLDSSSIVCVAHSLLESGQAEAPSLETVTHVYDKSPTSDERVCVKVVEAQLGMQSRFVLESECPAFTPFEEEHAVYIPSPVHGFAATYRRIAGLMREHGARVLLTGQGGDQICVNETTFYPILADLIRQGRFGELCRYLREWGKASRLNYLQLLWDGVIWPLAPLRFRKRHMPAQFALPSWFEPDFMKRTMRAERVVLHPDSHRFRGAARRRQHTLLRGAISFFSPGYHRERECVEASHPFLHQPLVEFMMAIPVEQILRPGETRSIQRRALGSFLPKEIMNRKSKRGPDEAVHRGIIREWPRLNELFTAGAQVFRRGYMNHSALQEALRRARHGLGGLHPILRTVSLENWLRVHEGRCSRPQACLSTATVGVSSQEVVTPARAF